MSKKIERILKTNALTEAKHLKAVAKELKALQLAAKNELFSLFEKDFGFSFNEFQKYLKSLDIEVSMCCDFVGEDGTLPHLVFKMPTHECTCSVKRANGAIWYDFKGSCNMSLRNDGGMAIRLNGILERIQRVPPSYGRANNSTVNPLSISENPLAFASPHQEGMTLLDYFAGVALPFVINDNQPIQGDAKTAYDYAEAMLKERQKRMCK
jgi:hypothetical protein